MMRPLVIGMLGGVLVLVSILSGCGSDSATTGPNYAAASGTLDAAAASTTLSTVLNAVQLDLTSIPKSIPASNVRDTLYSACSTVVPTTTTDLDKDGIPATREITYACNGIPHGNITLTLNGTESQTDADDSVATGTGAGYKYVYNYTGGHSGGETFGTKGTWEMTKDPTTKVSKQTGDWKGSGSNTDQNTGAVEEYEYGSTYSHVVTPDSARESKTGKVEFSGYFGSRRKGSTNKGSPDHDYVAKYSSKDLVYDTTCSHFYKSGTATFEAGTGKMVMTFQCSSNPKVVDGDGKTINY